MYILLVLLQPTGEKMDMTQFRSIIRTCEATVPVKDRALWKCQELWGNISLVTQDWKTAMNDSENCVYRMTLRIIARNGQRYARVAQSDRYRELFGTVFKTMNDLGHVLDI